MKHLFLPTIGYRVFSNIVFLLLTGGMIIQDHFQFWREGAIIGGLAIFAINTIYFVLTDKEIIKVVGFIFRQRVPLKEIERVRKGVDHSVLRFPTVSVDYTNRRGRKCSLDMVLDMGMGIEFVGEKQTREFLIELLRLRPDISINSECRRFLENADPPRKNWKDELIAAMFPGRDKSHIN